MPGSTATEVMSTAVIPFVSSYEPLWLGLGAVSLDLMAAVIVTSLLRGYLGRRIWRGVHWLAYASWPVAVLHSVYSSRDLQSGPLLYLTLACVAAALAALTWRVAAARAVPPRARRVPELMARRWAPPDRPPGPARPPMARAGER